MAATAAFAVASSFSTSMQSLKCISSKNWSNDSPLKISCPRTVFRPASVSHSLGIQELNPISKRKVSRIAAAVAQEEEALTAPVEEAPSEAEEVEEEAPPSDEVVAAESGGINTKLFFGNLPFRFDSAQLAEIIQEHAIPELVEVLYERATGKSRGIAFVTMSSIEDCNMVIQNLDGREYGGRTLRVKFAYNPKPRRPLHPEAEHRLFVENLAWSVTSEILTEAFQEYGHVVRARVLYDRETGRSHGYGSVSFETRAEMETALQALNGVVLEGRRIRVSLARWRKQ